MNELREICGLPFDDERLTELLAAYRPILEAIETLREVDLKDVHPAVRFDPSIPYRQNSEGAS